MVGHACWTADGRAGDGRPERDLQLDVLLDGQAIGLIGAFRQGGNGEVSARRKELEELGIRVPPAFRPDDAVPLSAIPALTYRYDEAAQRIDLRLPQGGRLPKTYDAAARDTSSTTASAAGTGAVLNYTLFGSSDSKQIASFWRYPSLSANLDARIFSPFGVLSQTGIVSDTSLVGGGTEVRRLETSWSYSDPGTMLTYRAGDTISGGLAWTRPIRMGGLQLQRNFGLRPDLITLPLPSVTGSAAVPSTVDVFVNGTKTISQDVGSGPFRITNIPILSGNGNASVVVRDASGQQTETNLPFIVSSKLLRPGLFDFSAEVGVPRLQYGLRSSIYGDEIAGLGSARYGISDNVTVMAHAEATRALGTASLGGTFGLGRFGLLTAAGAASWQDGATGGQGYLSFETQLWGLSFLASSQRASSAYRDLASVTAPPVAGTAGLAGYVATAGYPVADAASWGRLLLVPRALDRISVGLPAPVLGGGVSLGFAQVKPAVGRANRVVNASYTRSLPGGGSLYATVFTDLDERRSAGLFAGLSFPFGTDITSSTGASRSGANWLLAADVSKPLRQEVGSVGWRVRDVEGQQKQRSAALAYRGNFGQIEGGITQGPDRISGTAQLDGSIALAGGDLFLGNRIDDAFAVAKAGAPNVDVLYENRVVARTNASGNALIPILRSYQSNRISIDPRGLPVTSLAETTLEVMAPTDRAGVVVDFGVRSASNAAIVILHGADGKPLKAGLSGALQPGLRGTPATAPAFVVGYDGRAFIENLDAENDIVVQLDKGECRARFAFESRQAAQVTLGPVSCR